MTKVITHEDIAGIYEQLGTIEMRKVQDQIKKDPRDVGEHSLDRAFEFYNRADQVRENGNMKPLRPDIRIPRLYVRAETAVW